MADFDFDREKFRDNARSIALRVRFFKSVADRLDRAIDRTNEELRVQHPDSWESHKQIVRLTFGLGKRIELGYNRTLRCTFALTADNSHLEALITNKSGNMDARGFKLLAFLLELGVPTSKLESSEPAGLFSKYAETAVKAYKMDLEPLPYRLHEIGPQEIAETVLAGIIRGYF